MKSALRRHAITLLMAFVLALGLSRSAWADHPPHAVGSMSEQQVGDVETVIRQYLLDHPEVIGEAIEKLREKQQRAEEQRLADAAKAVSAVNSKDHIRGNLSAPVKIVEFSDFECPFCKSFHSSMKQVMEEYGSSGKVAWVYRHFPLDAIHSKARKEAQASECANELGGNDGFWAFTDRLFEVTPSNNRLDLTLLPKIAEDIGLDRVKFEDCLAGDERGGKYAEHIEANLQDALASGGTGTPLTLVISSKGEVFPINGAQPYEVIKSIIDTALKQE